MTVGSRHLVWAVALLIACTGCPSVNDPAGLDAGSVLIDSSLDLPAGESVLVSEAAPACVQIGQPATTLHQAMAQQLNFYRIENGLEPLIYSKTLEAAADAHAKNLYARSFFDHIDPDGKNPGDRALDANFCHKYVGENIAAGQTNVWAAMQAWKNSPDHNQNMLKVDYVYVGMGRYTDPTGRQYWVQSFAYDVPQALAGR